MDRSKDWLRQAERDLEVGRRTANDGFYEHACFLSQQGAEKAVKAVCQAEKVAVWGHMISGLLRELSAFLDIPSDVENAGKALDHHYIAARYPNSFESGAPADYYTQRQADEAIGDAEEIIAFCKQHIPG